MKITVTKNKLEQIHGDVLAVFLFQGEKVSGEIEKLDKAISGSISEAVRLGDFKGKLYETTSIYTHGKVPAARILLVGAGKRNEFEPRYARNAAGAAARQAIRLGAKKLAIFLREDIDAETAIEGVGLATFDPGLYKTKKNENRGEIAEIVLIGQADDKSVKRAQTVTEATNWVRKLITEPANVMTPDQLVEETRKLAKNYKFGIEVIGEKEAAKLGMGAFVGVAKGSEESSHVVVLKYKGGGKDTLGIVGKGITFDSGGLSLKPSKGMWEMKMDMSGAATCLGIMKWIGETRPKANVIAVLPLTENLPSGRALKPGDVVQALNGKTIEVTNTDAEGRLVLADALVYAQKLGASHLVDLATLTGAINVALGNVAAGVMGKPDSWIEKIVNLGKEAGELFWQLPTYSDYKELLKSDIADLNNAPGGGQPSAVTGAGAIAGAMFLLEFVNEKIPLAHLDIAATAWLSGERPYLAKGPTGFGVRTLVKLIEDMEKE
ncbi:MAG: leucyl aminopeptidase [bacterium]|nr:leucyl aminopeptidase [bacterium]